MTASIHKFTFKALGGACELVLDGLSAAQAQPLMLAAQQEIQRIEHKYSRYRADSLLSRLNHQAGGEPVECDQETLQLFAHANALYNLSQGLFDITCGVLRRAWNFNEAVVPAAQKLQPLLELIDWHLVTNKDSHVLLTKPGMEVDFGGFGKEYAADRAATVLLEAGCQHGYVNLAGDFRMLGPKADDSPWMIGIKHPRQPDEVMATIALTSGALATSGDYERYIEVDGKRYCHILNPHTGLPASHWQSVSVLAPLALVAGSYSTIAMLMELKALEFLQLSGLPYLAVDQQGRSYQNQAHTAGNPAAAWA
jgi:FAD:protein FMN transferase